ncbi:hypothetical protein D3C74_314850 [compost metagenome]
MCPSRDWRADNNILLARILLQQDRICRKQYHVQRRAILPRDPLQAITLLGIHTELQRMPVILLYSGTHIICRHLQYWQLAIELAQPVGSLLVHALALRFGLLPYRIILILNPQSW